MDWRPIVFEQMEVQQQSPHTSVSVAEWMYRFESVMEPNSERDGVFSLNIPLLVFSNHIVHLIDDSLHARRDVSGSDYSDIHPPPPARIDLHTSEDRFVQFEDCLKANRMRFASDQITEDPFVLQGLDDIVDRSATDASPLHHELPDLVPSQSIPFDGISAPGIQSAGPFPDVVWKVLKRCASDQGIPERFEYAFTHDVISKHILYINKITILLSKLMTYNSNSF